VTVGLLPLEKIPVFVWGLILVAVGGFLALNAPVFSWEQAKATGLLLLGLAAVAYDVVKRSRRKKQKKPEDIEGNPTEQE